ncbi:MAG: radical SAM protein, partial [Gemmataceae bacterium]
MPLELPTIASAPKELPLRPFLDTPRDEFQAWLSERGQPALRWKQIRRWILMARATEFAQMTDLPKDLREELPQHFTIFAGHVDRHLVASDDTHKLLLRWPDDRVIECVLIQDEGRATACISTQVGCAMGCVFCASGLEGVARNLTVGELLEQLVRLRNLTPAEGRLSHIVVMGMGEPLANLETLLEGLATATDPAGLGIGARHITISTVGLPPKIRRLAESGKQYHLAVSL